MRRERSRKNLWAREVWRLKNGSGNLWGVFLHVGELRALRAKISLFLHVDVISGSFEKLIFVCGYYKELYTKIVDADTYSLFLTY